MIVFLNFAPINFIGGAELWLKGIAKETNKYEKTYVITVAPNIADLYGQLVLKRKFSDNMSPNVEQINTVSLDLISFVPFTRKYQIAKNIFKEARLIYLKFELLEILIVLYYLGTNAFKKVIGGIHSPLHYHISTSFFSKLHNWVYTSSLYGYVVRRLNKIHVLNIKDLKFLKEKYDISNVIQLYDGVDMKKNELFNKKLNNQILKIIVVGELSIRKGTDIVINVIKNSPKNFFYTVVGDGPLKELASSLTDKYRCTYHGHLHDKKKINDLYRENDVLLFPSRAETLGLVMPEAMNFGLKIVNSEEVKLDAPSYIEYSSKSENHQEYLRYLQEIQAKKNNTDKKKIHDFAYKNFSNDVIYPKFLSQIFSITI